MLDTQLAGLAATSHLSSSHDGLPTIQSVSLLISVCVNQYISNCGSCGCSDRTFVECLEKKLFATKDVKDITDIGKDTAMFLWNCFQRELYGVWVSVDQGNLDRRAFGGKFEHQVQL